MHHFHDRNYRIIEIQDLPNLEFEDLLDNNSQTLKYSLNGNKFIIKYKYLYDINTQEYVVPPSILACNSVSQEYSHSEIETIIQTSEWYQGGE